MWAHERELEAERLTWEKKLVEQQQNRPRPLKYPISPRKLMNEDSIIASKIELADKLTAAARTRGGRRRRSPQKRSDKQRAKSVTDLVNEFGGGEFKPTKHHAPDDLHRLVLELEARLTGSTGEKSATSAKRGDNGEGELHGYGRDSDYDWDHDDNCDVYVGDDSNYEDVEDDPEVGDVTYIRTTAAKGTDYLTMSDMTGIKVGQHWTLNQGQTTMRSSKSRNFDQSGVVHLVCSHTRRAARLRFSVRTLAYNCPAKTWVQ